MRDVRDIVDHREMSSSKSNPLYLYNRDLLDKNKSHAEDRRVWKSPILKVESVKVDLVKSRDAPKGDEMLFLCFVGCKKRLGLNSGHRHEMERLTGSANPNKWVGATIQLYVDPNAKLMGGERGPAIRIRPMVPRGAVETSPGLNDDAVEAEEDNEDEPKGEGG